MAIQIQGNGGTVVEVDGPTYKALRVQARPLDVGSLGAYAISLATGTMAAALAAGSEVVQFRWTDATRFAVIDRVVLDGAGNAGTAFAAGFVKFDIAVARAWSADGSGGTSATLTGNNQKLRTAFPTTLLAAVRAASTAALTAGTKVLDSQAIGAVVSAVPATAGAVVCPEGDLFNPSTGTLHPLVLAGTGGGEGFVVRATVPITGTWSASWSIRWTEVTAY